MKNIDDLLEILANKDIEAEILNDTHLYLKFPVDEKVRVVNDDSVPKILYDWLKDCNNVVLKIDDGKEKREWIRISYLAPLKEDDSNNE